MAYFGQTAVLTTKHHKEVAIAPLFAEVLGMNVIVHHADTDQLGTFSGSIPRLGSMEETITTKANLGLEATGLQFAIASEGAFGPHPISPFIPLDSEMLIFVDQTRDFKLIETIMSTETNYNPQENTDMRAHVNHQRMSVIHQACQKLVQRLARYCPQCNAPGFGLIKPLDGLPCETCGSATPLIQSEVFGCTCCEHQVIQPRLGAPTHAPTQYCQFCNP